MSGGEHLTSGTIPEKALAPLSLARMAAIFLKIGTIGFGGGMANIALIEHEFIRERKLMGPEEYL